MVERWPAIKQIEDEVSIARRSAIVGIKGFQADCPHDKVVEGESRRICASCGIEEAVSYPAGWPSITRDGGFYEFMRPAGLPTILNTEFVKRGDVTRYRVSI